MNNEYEITAEAPLLRAGLKIKTTCSEKYLIPCLDMLMSLIRDFNIGEANR